MGDGANMRLSAVGRVLADPPQVHGRANSGVWSSSESVYELMARACQPGSRTLETGLGVSTALFASWGTEHICVVHSQQEVDAIRAYFDDRNLSNAHVRYCVGSSDQVLPSLELPELDLVFIDGSHAFPLPIIDWYYGCGALRRGGLLILDDTNLKGVTLGLGTFLEKDPRWDRVGRSIKWRAYRRLSSGPLAEPHENQAFLKGVDFTRLESLVPFRLRKSAKAVARRIGIL
jgi:hypothetical protein